jgi:hypothetical protein
MATDTSAPLPDLIVDAGTTYTVTLDDASAVITQLVVHGDQTAGPDITAVGVQRSYLIQSDSDLGRNPADFGGPA